MESTLICRTASNWVFNEGCISIAIYPCDCPITHTNHFLRSRVHHDVGGVVLCQIRKCLNQNRAFTHSIGTAKNPNENPLAKFQIRKCIRQSPPIDVHHRTEKMYENVIFLLFFILPSSSSSPFHQHNIDYPFRIAKHFNHCYVNLMNDR